MSFVMEIRKCPACGKKYNWNPSVIACPHCLGFGNIDKPKKSTGGLFGKKKNEPSDN